MTRVEKPKYTYIYNCSNRPEINEFINSYIKAYFDSSVLILQASLPNYVKESLNENIDETTQIKTSIRLTYGSLGLFPNSFWSKIDSSFPQIDFPVFITTGIDSGAIIGPNQPVEENSDLYVPSDCFISEGGISLLTLKGQTSLVLLDIQENKIYYIVTISDDNKTE